VCVCGGQSAAAHEQRPSTSAHGASLVALGRLSEWAAAPWHCSLPGRQLLQVVIGTGSGRQPAPVSGCWMLLSTGLAAAKLLSL